MKNLLKNFAMIALVLSFTACSDDDNDGGNTPAKNIATIATETADLSILVQALNRAGLVATFDSAGDYTVFAPTNAAFPVLTEILKNHVLSEGLKSADLTTGYYKTLAKGTASSTNTISMFINLSSGVVLNGGASNGGASVVLNRANIEASNGIIHVVDRVIGLPTVVNHAIANPSFSTLVTTITMDGQPDFVNILSGTGSFTVFAPTNDAFTALTAELVAMEFVPTTEQLTTVLQYHVVAPANVLAGSLTEGQVVTPLAGGTFTVSLMGGAKITDGSARVTNIITTDVQASNGVIHAIDRVLLPNLAE